ncbi:hypothetical protein AB0M48_12180 [Lentzea sp. NPDC051208]|uniref:hypothetical protein n=1 Tax=Lentzea sp. NPDC051208 TaxID=3154642 RepID=UPI00344AB458
MAAGTCIGALDPNSMSVLRTGAMSGVTTGPAVSVETGIPPVSLLSAFAVEETDGVDVLGVVDALDVVVVPVVVAVVAADVVDAPGGVAVGADGVEVFEAASGVVAGMPGDAWVGVSAGLPAVVTPCALPAWDSFELSVAGTAGSITLFPDDLETPVMASADARGAGDSTVEYGPSARIGALVDCGTSAADDGGVTDVLGASVASTVDIGASVASAVDIGAVDIGAVDIGAVDIGAVDAGASAGARVVNVLSPVEVSPTLLFPAPGLTPAGSPSEGSPVPPPVPDPPPTPSGSPTAFPTPASPVPVLTPPLPPAPALPATPGPSACTSPPPGFSCPPVPPPLAPVPAFPPPVLSVPTAPAPEPPPTSPPPDWTGLYGGGASPVSIRCGGPETPPRSVSGPLPPSSASSAASARLPPNSLRASSLRSSRSCFHLPSAVTPAPITTPLSTPFQMSPGSPPSGMVMTPTNTSVRPSITPLAPQWPAHSGLNSFRLPPRKPANAPAAAPYPNDLRVSSQSQLLLLSIACQTCTIELSRTSSAPSSKACSTISVKTSPMDFVTPATATWSRVLPRNPEADVVATCNALATHAENRAKMICMTWRINPMNGPINGHSNGSNHIRRISLAAKTS